MVVQVRVLGEAYTPDDEEDSAMAEVTNVWVYQARYRVPLPRAVAGALLLVSPPCFYELSASIRMWPPSACS